MGMCLARKGATVCSACLEVEEREMLWSSEWPWRLRRIP